MEQQITPYGQAQREGHSFCSLPQMPERIVLPADMNPNRAELIRVNLTKWANGTVLRYYFFDRESDGEQVLLSDGNLEWRTWTTTEAEKEVVRRAFDIWKAVGIGLSFKEVSSRNEAEIRIGFQRGDGAWSYIGRAILDFGPNERTMNFGWDLTRDPQEIDTAVHEIGHTLGFPHEHQNPNAGIIWDEESVYAALAAAPNFWDREKTFYNIIRKINPDTVQGSTWDPDSIMHYSFEAGLIREPTRYRTGLTPAGGLSRRDVVWVRMFYPPLDDRDLTPLRPFQSVLLGVTAGGQRNFVVEPDATRFYDFRTFGVSDSVMVMFEEVNGDLRFATADDDSGEDRNATLRVKLFQGRKYILRIRVAYSERPEETAIMMW